MTDEIPALMFYKGIKVHDCQPAARVEGVVQPEIDEVIALSNVGELFEWACDPCKAPESRLFAAAKCRAAVQIAANGRRTGPGIDAELLQAHVAGLDSVQWRDPRHYGTLLQHPMPPGAKPLPERDAESAALVEKAAKAARG